MQSVPTCREFPPVAATGGNSLHKSRAAREFGPKFEWESVCHLAIAWSMRPRTQEDGYFESCLHPITAEAD